MTGKRQALAACLALTLLTLIGCGQKTEGSPAPQTSQQLSAPTAETAQAPQPSETVSPPADSPLPDEVAVRAAQDEFRAKLETEGNEKAALDILRRVAPDLGPSDVTWMFFALEDYQKAAVQQGTIIGAALVQLIQSASETPYDEKALNDLATVRDPGLEEALRAVFDRGYRLVIPEGDYQAIIDYGTYGAIAPYLPQDLAAYVGIRAVEARQRMLEDGGIIIPLDEVLRRALACEKFMITYNTSQRAEEISNLYSGYIDAYFFGSDNTPAFDISTGELNAEFLDSYTKNASDRQDSAFIAALSAYLRTLSENGYNLNEDVSDARDKFTEPLRLKPCYG